MNDYDDVDDEGRQRQRFRNTNSEGQPAVRKHLTIFSTIFRTYENKLYGRTIRDLRLHQPHFNYMRNIATPHSYKHHPADGICAHFLLHGFNRLQKSPVNVGCWSAEARRLVLGTQSGEFTLWEGETFKFERLISTHTPHAVRAMAWSNNGQMLISGDHSGIIKYFNSSITFVNSITEAHTSAVRGLSFSPIDTKFVSCSEDKTVRVWDWERAETESVLEEHLSDVRCCAWHPHRSLIVSGSKDNTIKLWDPRQAASVNTIFSHKNTILSCGWSCNGNLLATGGRDHLAKIFDIRVMKDLATLRGHNKEVCSLAWHPVQDSVLLTGGFNGTLIHWIVGHEGPHTIIANAHNYSVNMIAWHPIGHTVGTASNDGILKFWSREPPGSKLDLEPGEWSEQLQTHHGPLDATSVSAISESLYGASLAGKGGGGGTQAAVETTSRVPRPSTTQGQGQGQRDVRRSQGSSGGTSRDHYSRPPGGSAPNTGPLGTPMTSHHQQHPQHQQQYQQQHHQHYQSQGPGRPPADVSGERSGAQGSAMNPSGPADWHWRPRGTGEGGRPGDWRNAGGTGQNQNIGRGDGGGGFARPFKRDREDNRRPPGPQGSPAQYQEGLRKSTRFS